LDYVKRVIAQEGDVVRMRDDVVSINGGDLPQELVDEHCRPPQDHAGCRLLRETDGRRSYMIMLTEPSSRDFGPITVPPGKVFVLGDNRDNSSDSRSWGFVPVENIKGAVWLVWWSRGEPEGIRWDRVGQRPGQAR
jgi:signal peptidase I